MLAQPDSTSPSRRFVNLAITALGIGALIAAMLFIFYQLGRPVSHRAVRSGPSTALSSGDSTEVTNASDSPSWTALNVSEKAALYPLAGEWSRLGASGQAKWLAIADRFPNMTQSERERTQERMAEWAKLTPEQRRIARDSYVRAHALPPEKRAELLQKYQDLPDQEKEHLAETARQHRSVVAIKARPKDDQPLPSKAQIREGSQQPVPGIGAATRPAGAGPAGLSSSPANLPAASSVPTAGSVAGSPGLPAIAPAGASPQASPAPPSAATTAVPAAAPSPGVQPGAAPAQSSAQPAASNSSHL